MKKKTETESAKKSAHSKKSRKWLLAAIICVAAAAALIWHGNRIPETTRITVASERVPESFDGFEIAQVSDLHGAELGRDNSRVLDALRQSAPDIIAVTGDLVDSGRPDVTAAISFIREAAKIAPVYYITGNHEAARRDYAAIEAAVSDAGATVLRNEGQDIEAGGEAITIAGVDDPGFVPSTDAAALNRAIDAGISKALGGGESYTVLLSHRPELFQRYVSAGVDLALCGHAHGGLVRLPFVGGLIAPGQGLFPAYDSGLYSEGDTDMVVSRGVGNSGFFFRVNDPPEIMIVTLSRK